MGKCSVLNYRMCINTAFTAFSLNLENVLGAFDKTESCVRH